LFDTVLTVKAAEKDAAPPIKMLAQVNRNGSREPPYLAQRRSDFVTDVVF
jgi:hypothetical protein